MLYNSLMYNFIFTNIGWTAIFEVPVKDAGCMTWYLNP